MGEADVATAASSASAIAILSVKKRFSFCANSKRVLRRCLRWLAFLMCFSRAFDTVSNMLYVRYVGSDVEAVMEEIESGSVGSSSSLRSENLFEEGPIACNDCGDGLDVGRRQEGGMVVHTVSRMAEG